MMAGFANARTFLREQRSVLEMVKEASADALFVTLTCGRLLSCDYETFLDCCIIVTSYVS